MSESHLKVLNSLKIEKCKEMQHKTLINQCFAKYLLSFIEYFHLKVWFLEAFLKIVHLWQYLFICLQLVLPLFNLNQNYIQMSF